MTTLWPFLEENPRYRQLALLERLVEPERVIQFRVVWVDDRNQVQVNRAWRVQFNSAIGRIKAGCVFTRRLTCRFSNSLASSRPSKTP